MKKNLTKLLVIMKVTFTQALLIVFFSTVGIARDAFSQEDVLKRIVTVEVVNKTLRIVLSDIEKEANMHFAYLPNVVDAKRIISVSAKKQALATVLDQILLPLSIQYEVSGNYIILSKITKTELTESLPNKPITPPAFTISGTVTDENGEPLVGASVVLEGTIKGVLTDLSGKYTLELTDSEKNGKLQFSFVGYEKQNVLINGRTQIDIVLTSGKALNEVVVVGYGTQKRINMTGSVATLNTKELGKVPVDNLNNMLGGRLAGVITRQQSGVPGDNAAKFFIRGRSSPTGSGQPLLIVDGVERAFDNLDPNEIETISILKDASAAVYGVRAANGVVLVTTKRGKDNQNLNINFTSTYSASTNTAFPEYPDGVAYATWHNKARALDGLPQDYTAEDIEKIKNNDPNSVFGNSPWTKMIFEKYAPQTYQNLNISGGNGKLRFFTNVAFLKQGGIIKDVSFDRTNIRSNIEYQLNQNMQMSLNLAGRLENRNQPGTSPGAQDITINNYKNIVFYSILARPTNKPTLPDGTDLGWGNPFVARDKSGFFDRKNNIFQSNATIQAKIPQIKGLTLKGNFAYDYENGISKWFITPNRLATWEYGRRELVYFDRLMPKDVASNKNELHQRFSDYVRITTQASADYNNTFGNHQVSGLVLFEEQGTKTSNFGVGGQDLPLTSLPDLNFATNYINNSAFGSRGQRGTRGIVGRVGYAFKKRYLAELTSRVDWSTRFPKANRMGVFPAASIGWNIAEESFFKNRFKFVDNLKLRGSVGLLGNDAIADFIYLKTFRLATQPQLILGDNAYLDVLTGAVPNYNLTWEKTTTYNGGFDMDLWQSKLTVEFDYFYKVTRDILQNVAGLYPPSVGGNFPSTQNAGVMDAKGFELVIKHNNAVNRDFRYQISGNVSLAQNRYVKTDESPNVPSWQRRTGRPFGSILGWVSDGLYQNEADIANGPVPFAGVLPGYIRYKDLNGDGVINAADRTWIGRSPIPELMGGFNFSVSYKNWTVGAFFQGAARTDFMLTGEYLEAGFSDGTFFTQPFKWGANTPYFILNNTWQKDGDQTEFPRLSTVTPTNNNIASDFWKRDAAYLRLKTAEISYSLPLRLKKGNTNSMSNLTIYASGTNLLTFSGLKYLDPESPTVSNGFYPQQRVFNLGFNLMFK
jgi:TonB-linked SusC/RagA family outer membrane protein